MKLAEILVAGSSWNNVGSNSLINVKRAEVKVCSMDDHEAGRSRGWQQQLYKFKAGLNSCFQ